MRAVPLSEGQFHSDDGCRVDNVLTFEPNVVDADVLENFEFPEGRHCTHSHDCCGNFYPNKVKIARTEKEVVATQVYYQNV